MKRSLACLACAWLALSLMVAARGVPTADTATALHARFARPPAEYSSAPLWVWNDDLDEEMVRRTMRELAAEHVRQVFVHPRPGLMTPYLSGEWFKLWKAALDEAARLGVRVWIYDENSYPSGFAGGFVPEAMAESRGRGVVLREEKTLPALPPPDDLLAVFVRGEEGYREVTAAVRGSSGRLGEPSLPLPAGPYLVASLAEAKNGPWYGGKFYVDLLRPGVTEKFLELTLDAYKREIGEHFGTRVPGVFTDEPHLRPAGGLPWTDGLPNLFEQRWGYPLRPNLAALAAPSGDWRRVRHNYYQLLLEGFVERWGKPYYDYCERNRLEFTGHYWEHEWPNCQSVPDNMAMSAWQQRPGIDILMNQYAEDVHAQFGNVRAVKEVASVANQLGRARTLAEGYGAGGWDLRFADMKRIGDWMYVLGINTLDQHLSYVSIRGARKRDHPQSFSYHEPWWKAYHASADYFARLSVALSAGEQVNEVLVIEPTTTAWMYNTSGTSSRGELDALGSAFQALVMSLEKAQVEYDLGSEDVMARHGAVARQGLRVGRRTYHTVVLPPMAENLNATTVALLEGFLGGGGRVLVAGPTPTRVDGAISDRGKALAARKGWTTVAASDVPAALAPSPDGDFAITRTTADRGILFHHRRRVQDGELVFLVNTSADARSSGTIDTRAGGVEEWVPATGAARPYPFETTASGSRLRFDLPEGGSLLLRFTNRRPAGPRAVPGEKVRRFAVSGAPQTSVKRVGPNVLVLDYVDVRAGGERREKVHFYQAAQFAFQKNGMERNPWDSAVQFRDELRRRVFPADSGVEVTYRFTVKDAVPAPLWVVVERPDLYTVTCNGRRVAAGGGEWWLDRAFGKIDIAPAARTGENEVVLTASPFTVRHEIEPAYLLGSFSLQAAPSGFLVVPDRPLALGAWDAQGHPFYAEGVAYTETFQVAQPSTGAYRVQLTRWHGSVAAVRVNGREAGEIVSAPWDLDVTRLLRPGANEIEVRVIGTLKNTLGPHHGKPALGTAWPSMFQKAPEAGPPAGGEYSVVSYGMFSPFTLVRELAGR